MDFYVVKGRPGYRMTRKKHQGGRVGSPHRVAKDDTIAWFKKKRADHIFREDEDALKEEAQSAENRKREKKLEYLRKESEATGGLRVAVGMESFGKMVTVFVSGWKRRTLMEFGLIWQPFWLGRVGASTRMVVLEFCRLHPVLARVNLFADPWDIGLGGYQFWKEDSGELSELASRMTASGDFVQQIRPPALSFRQLCHHPRWFHLSRPGLPQREAKQGKREDNRDGSNDNASWNYGCEGVTEDEGVGTTMLLAGDEFGRTQGGNNNTYCQNNEINWLDWEGIWEEGKPQAEFCLAVDPASS
ncbi:hypothetical protein HDV00_010833 [Rhizophlyctis rosea]|nr:hypothetical protein HDV00_010833 [Rhizophlyctis rosea]